MILHDMVLVCDGCGAIERAPAEFSRGAINFPLGVPPGWVFSKVVTGRVACPAPNCGGQMDPRNPNVVVAEPVKKIVLANDEEDDSEARKRANGVAD